MAARWGLWGGLAAFILMLLLPAPAGMSPAAWRTTAIIVLMATWWMTEALPLTATALVPFLAFPLLGVMTATDSAAAYYSPILFLVLGGAIIAMGIAFAATIGGFGTLVGSPTNAIAVGIIEKATGYRIDFLTWALYGIPLVLVSVPLCWAILMKVQKVSATDFDPEAARAGIGETGRWSTAEKRLVPLVALTVAAWIALPFVTPYLPKDSLTDGTIAVVAALLLFVIPDGTGRAILNWEEANRAPWGVIMMFGGGLALAAGMGQSGLGEWLGTALQPLRDVHPLVVAIAIVAIVIVITEFASNVAA